MTPLDFVRMEQYLGFDVQPCFSPLEAFTAYVYGKKVQLSPQGLYVVQRGAGPTSLDSLLYQLAVEARVEVVFSDSLEPGMLSSVPEGSLIAVGTYSGLMDALGIRFSPFIHYDTKGPMSGKQKRCVAYFESYVAGYKYGYVAVKDGCASAEVDLLVTQPYQEDLRCFQRMILETEGFSFESWEVVEDAMPREVSWCRRVAGKSLVLAGALAGFHDPLFGFGVNSALVSGRIAAETMVSKKKGYEEFKRFSGRLQLMFLLSRVYMHLPLRDRLVPWLFQPSGRLIPFVGKNFQSIPGFVPAECFKIEKVENCKY